MNYEEKMKELIAKWGRPSKVLIQLKLKVSFDKAAKLQKQYCDDIKFEDKLLVKAT